MSNRTLDNTTMTELVPLLDGEGAFTTYHAAFGVGSDAPWHVPFYAFAARVGDATLLVDTGLGPAGTEFLPAWESRLPQALAASRIAPEDVDVVVLTHLHVDHVGWTMRDGMPFFPNAHYVAHRDDYDWIVEVDGDERYVQESVVELATVGRLDLIEHDAEPLPGVAVLWTGGHTPGHCIVELPAATLLGDLAVSEPQLADPSLAYDAEQDPAAAAEWRRRLFPPLADSGRLVGFAHLGLGRLVPEGGGFGWRPASAGSGTVVVGHA